jgi:hypothetical protein
MCLGLRIDRVPGLVLLMADILYIIVILLSMIANER